METFAWFLQKQKKIQIHATLKIKITVSCFKVQPFQ